MHFIIYYRINSNLVESSNEIKEKKNQLRNHLLYLLVWPFGLSYRWSSEVPDIVFLIDGVLKFQTLVDYFDSYIFVEIASLLLVILPTWAIYKFTKEE